MVWLADRGAPAAGTILHEARGQGLLAAAGVAAGPPPLGWREVDVLAALAVDPAASQALLAVRLGVSSGTVRKHLDGVRAGLGVGKELDGAALVALARERGVLAAEPGTGGRLVAFRPRPEEEG